MRLKPLPPELPDAFQAQQTACVTPQHSTERIDNLLKPLHPQKRDSRLRTSCSTIICDCSISGHGYESALETFESLRHLFDKDLEVCIIAVGLGHIKELIQEHLALLEGLRGSHDCRSSLSTSS